MVSCWFIQGFPAAWCWTECWSVGSGCWLCHWSGWRRRSEGHSTAAATVRRHDSDPDLCRGARVVRSDCCSDPDNKRAVDVHRKHTDRRVAGSCLRVKTG